MVIIYRHFAHKNLSRRRLLQWRCQEGRVPHGHCRGWVQFQLLAGGGTTAPCDQQWEVSKGEESLLELVLGNSVYILSIAC